MDKIYKALLVSLLTIGILFIFELISFIPGFQDLFLNLMNNDKQWIVWLSMWLIMFLQVTFIPIPAISILIMSNNMNLITFNFIKDLPFYLVVMSAYIVGVIVAYIIGYKWGRKAVDWVSGDPKLSDKWSNVINEKGKFYYFLTVLFPIFPDDILCMAAGAIKLDFKYFLISNIIGRFIGLVTTIYVLLTTVNLVGSMNILIIYGTLMLINVISVIIIKKRLTAKQ